VRNILLNVVLTCGSCGSAAFVLDGPDLSKVKPEFEDFDLSSIQIKETKTDLAQTDIDAQTEY